MSVAHNTYRLSLNMRKTQLNSNFSQMGHILTQEWWELLPWTVDDRHPSSSFCCLKYTQAHWALLPLLPSLGHTPRNSRFRMWVIQGTSRGATWGGWGSADARKNGILDRTREQWSLIARDWKIKKLRAILYSDTAYGYCTPTLPRTFASSIMKCCVLSHSVVSDSLGPFGL